MISIRPLTLPQTSNSQLTSPPIKLLNFYKKLNLATSIILNVKGPFIVKFCFTIFL